MTKSKGFSGVLKKRAGLKKQAILQSKKQYLKKLKWSSILLKFIQI